MSAPLSRGYRIAVVGGFLAGALGISGIVVGGFIGAAIGIAGGTWIGHAPGERW